MKYISILLSKKLHLLLFIVFLYGCSSGISMKEHVNDWMSRPVSELKQAMKSPDSYASKIGWKETTYPLAGGNSVYVEPFSENCSIHWEITPRGTIIRYRAVGKGCEQESSSDAFIRNLMPPPQ
ncbi:MAG: hypothetical protein A2X55_10750 [Nitrospirae bacterium GWB2_47_37]|nr:MAG: hypothetical protein A2Z82_11580 [Nitrospirae bacterium GWA2_46_11]OGW23791.1 MAG: hypothetical protein A2X55_10750 [Nitrospirae bacterium GWB2_47_37]HAK89388.1 hypothetical protein [Nitrospiraceae bacterium]